ncbi:hypothetical protein [Paraburkholderia hospita]|jgi:hypothetical protein|uniref:hypothetical protein n=1 Tax=Paraburkholderia hospita TaxID=169430 RepID=UPI003ED086C9
MRRTFHHVAIALPLAAVSLTACHPHLAAAANEASAALCPATLTSSLVARFWGPLLAR